MTRPEPDTQQDRALLESRLAYHLRCLREDATDPELSNLERLAVVRERVTGMHKIRRELAAPAGTPRRPTRRPP